LLETDNKSSIIILFAELFEQERSENYLKTETLFSELLNIIDIIEKFAKISKKSEIQA